MTRPLTAFLVTLLAVSILFPFQPSGAKQEWVEVRSPNFIVVSNSGEKEARKTAVHFEQIRAVFRRSLAVAGQHPSPLITILAAKDEGTMKSLLPEYWAKNHAHPAGIFVDRDNMYFAAVQLNTEGTNPYHTIFHEYYHSLTLPYYPNLPLWVAEGLADFWGNTDVNGADVQMGRPDENLVLELRQSSLIPLDVLFKVDHSSPYYNEQEKTSMFYAESWALTHYLMIGDKASHRPMLAAYLDAVSQGATPEQAAAKGFGDLKHLQSALEAYVRSNSFYILKGSAPPEIPQSDLKVRELSEAEVDVYRGGFQTIRGNGKDAIPILEQAVKTDPKLALGYQYLAYAEFANGKRQEALADFSRAIELDPNNAVTRYMRARLYAMSGGDQEKIKADLRAAIAADPNFASAYGILAVYMAGNRENLPEALTLAKKATSLEPGNSTYQFDMAQVLLAMNRIADARTVATAARKNAIYPGQRQQAEQFLQSLDTITNSSGAESNPSAKGQGDGSAVPAAGSTGAKGNVPVTVKKMPDGAGRKLVIQSGSKNAVSATVDGNVKEVNCNGNEMTITLNATDGYFTLHAKDATRVEYQKDVAFDSGDFQACTQLRGHDVTVTFVTVDGPKYDGEIQAVEIVK